MHDCAAPVVERRRGPGIIGKQKALLHLIGRGLESLTRASLESPH
jgi:hypothetical protein